MGDSTFFHAGLPGILNSVFNQHPITMILMENGTTAMTGHQDHAAVGQNFNGPTNKVPVRQVLEGLGVKHIFEIDTYQQSKLTELVKTAVEIPEFSVVIARHPCMLKFTREARRKPGYQVKQVHIDQELCNQAHACVASFGCPTFTRHTDGKVTINPDLCIGDGSCLQTCPTRAIEKPR
jgi:indolepyruvate ferredoxin oxidoreductase alpha subunit